MKRPAIANETRAAILRRRAERVSELRRLPVSIRLDMVRDLVNGDATPAAQHRGRAYLESMARSESLPTIDARQLPLPDLVTVAGALAYRAPRAVQFPGDAGAVAWQSSVVADARANGRTLGAVVWGGIEGKGDTYWPVTGDSTP